MTSFCYPLHTCYNLLGGHLKTESSETFHFFLLFFNSEKLLISSYILLLNCNTILQMNQNSETYFLDRFYFILTDRQRRCFKHWMYPSRACAVRVPIPTKSPVTTRDTGRLYSPVSTEDLFLSSSCKDAGTNLRITYSFLKGSRSSLLCSLATKRSESRASRSSSRGCLTVQR